jgi:hypothetical protein
MYSVLVQTGGGSLQECINVCPADNDPLSIDYASFSWKPDIYECDLCLRDDSATTSAFLGGYCEEVGEWIKWGVRGSREKRG